jgi:hypothetical protein
MKQVILRPAAGVIYLKIVRIYYFVPKPAIIPREVITSGP